MQSQKGEAEFCTIQAVIRACRIRRNGSDGNLLKAHSGTKKSEIEVDFTGTDIDYKSVFLVEKSEKVEANVLKFSAQNENYYLVVNKDGKVKLRKLEKPPTSDKYFFRIERTGRGFESPFTFKSLKTGEFLHCDVDGKAFMKPKAATDGRGQPKDIQTFFHLRPCKHTQVTKHEETMVTVGKEEETLPMDVEDGKSEDSGRGDSEILEPLDGHWEYQEIRIYVSSV